MPRPTNAARFVKLKQRLKMLWKQHLNDPDNFKVRGEITMLRRQLDELRPPEPPHLQRKRSRAESRGYFLPHHPNAAAPGFISQREATKRQLEARCHKLWRAHNLDRANPTIRAELEEARAQLHTMQGYRPRKALTRPAAEIQGYFLPVNTKPTYE